MGGLPFTVLRNQSPKDESERPTLASGHLFVTTHRISKLSSSDTDQSIVSSRERTHRGYSYPAWFHDYGIFRSALSKGFTGLTEP